MTPDDMTEQVYAFIRLTIERFGMPPTFREIATGCFISLGTVMRHVDRLEAQGRLVREQNKARSIRLVPAEAHNPE